MTNNINLYKAKINKNDEFYTLLEDVKKECDHYISQFEDKIIYLNCDNPEFSNFWKYFSENFEKFKLKKLISTHYENEKQTYKMEMFKDNNEICTTIKKLSGNGDFRSPECIELLKEADIIVTNPPFSLFREYVAQLIEYKKKFLIIGNINAITYKEIFPLLRDNKMWLGCSIHSGDRVFNVPDNYPLEASNCGINENGKKWIRVKGVRWFTNLDITKRHEEMILYKTYNPEDYPKYDNYDAIEVGKTANIPVDYNGVMGVPITFMDKYCPEQFEIIDINPYFFSKVEKGLKKPKQLTFNIEEKKDPYARILIKKK